MPPASRTRLPHVLAAMYGVAIVYASLEPFSPWLAPPPGTPFFLFSTSTRWIRYDAVLNVLAYVPFGVFVALLERGAHPARRVASSVIIGAAMSFSMESLQMYIPSRVASPWDVATNTAGALLGGVLATVVARNASARRTFYQARARLFLPGHLGDVGLGLLLLWLVAQTNPGIPLFAVTFDNDTVTALGAAMVATPAPHDAASAFVQAAGTAFQVLGVGLFGALLLRRRRYTGGIVLALILGALALKGVAAAIMLKPAIWQTWIRPGAIIGISVGAILLRFAIAMPRPVQVAVCAIALLSSLVAPVLAPETLSGRVPVALFDWHYGQLLNYNGLTRTALLLWPVMTAVWLFALAGRPAWGKPADPA
ncbi:MAG: VanZ family protein [Burkholderiales bacterium]